MSDCLIIGGGIIGMMSARKLAMMGDEITLLEQKTCGSKESSSWAAGGIISPLYPWHYDDIINQLSLQSQSVYQALCDDLYQMTGIDPEYQQSGLLMMDEYATIKAKNWLKRYQINYIKHPKGALFDKIAQVRSPKLLQALRADISKKKVVIYEHTKVDELIIKKHKVLGVKTTKGDFFADNVLICAGAWSGQLLPVKDEIFPIKGQMIVLKSKADSLQHIVLAEGKYMIPRTDGRILVGSTMENVGFDSSIDPTTKKNLHQFACHISPQLCSATVEYHWAGFRPSTQSGKPIIKKHSKYHNLFINTGHLSNGLNMAAASADKIAQLIK